MSQYRTGTISVTNGSATVTGTDTSWVGNVSVGQVIGLRNDWKAYEIAAVVSDTEITLTTTYEGSTVENTYYYIIRDYSEFLQLPLPNQGDVELAYIIRRALLALDTALNEDFPDSGYAAAAEAARDAAIEAAEAAGTLTQKTTALTSYTIVSQDYRCEISFTASTDVTVTVPSGLPSNFYCILTQVGDGKVEVVADVGVTVIEPFSRYKTGGIGSYIVVRRLAGGEIALAGEKIE